MAQHTKRKRRPRRRLAAVVLLAALAAGFLWWGNNDLMADRYSFSSPRLPAAFSGVRVVQLSDLHGKQFGAGNRRLLDAVAAERPDYIFITGDLVDENTRDPLTYAAQVGGALAAIAPVYYVTGNHEWALGHVRELKKALADVGVTVLTNQYVPLEKNGASILLAGVDDPNGYAGQKSPAQMAQELLAAYGGDDFRILLAHRNDRFANEYSLLGYDLTLTGHAHGGLVRLPGLGGLINHAGRLFPGYDAGFYEENGAAMFVSRGLGNIRPSFRVFNRPEIVILTLEKEAAT